MVFVMVWFENLVEVENIILVNGFVRQEKGEIKVILEEEVVVLVYELWKII